MKTMETKHSKGKWEVGINELTEEKEIFVKIDNGAALALLYENNSAVKGREQAIANAKLMASAPELLEALIQVQRFIIEQHLPSNNSNRMFAEENVIKAIKKATE